MPGSSVQTARLRALSPEDRAKKIAAAYRKTGSLERAARALKIPSRTLARILAVEDAAAAAVDEVRLEQQTP